MKLRAVSTLRRAAAWLVCLMVLLMQLALPALALTPEEIAAMPTVTVYYQTALDGQPTPMMATPTSDTIGKAYWVTLPSEAFGNPITLSIVPSPNTTFTFTPPDGEAIYADINTVDYTGTSTLITAYQDGVMMQEYRLYISAAALPVEPVPATVQVNYVDVDDQGKVLYSEQFTAYQNQPNIVYANQGNIAEAGYTLEGDESAAVMVDEYGNASPSTVTFFFRKAQEPKSGKVTVYYTDIGGNELINPLTLTLDPGNHVITPEWELVPAGYELSAQSPQQVEVTVDNDGNASREAVTFEFAEKQTQPTDEPTIEPTQSHTDEPTDIPTGGPTTDEPTDEPTDESTDTPAPELVPVGRYAQTNKVANFRTETSTDSKKAFSDVKANAYVWVYGTLDVTGKDGKTTNWASINYNGTDCYVLSDLITLLSQEDSDAYNYSQPSPVPGTETEAPPPPTDSPSPTPEVTQAPAQVTGYFITVTDAQLAAGPASSTVVATLPVNSVIYVEGQNYENGMAWHKTTVESGVGYVRADQVHQMTDDEVIDYLKPTPTPTLEATTAAPTATETVVATASPTVSFTPVDTPSPSPSSSPVVTPTTTTTTTQPDMYIGYGLTTSQIAIRSNVTLQDASIIAMLPVNTLVVVKGQHNVGDIVWSNAKTRLGESYDGFVQDSYIKRITDAEAQVLIDAYEAANNPPTTAGVTPTVTPTVSPLPQQVSGLYITLGNVPMRDVPDINASFPGFIPQDTVVQVAGQTYHESVGWHITYYGSNPAAYVRLDQLRKLTAQEEAAYYAAKNTPTPSPAPNTPKPYDPYAPSSYGYVASSSVNFRSTPSTTGSRIKTLQQYAFALILGTRQVGNTTWYQINNSGTVGWVSGDYFKVLNLTELSQFLTSKEYLQGITNNSSSSGSTGNTSGNNSSSGNTGNNSSGSSTAGNQSLEDYNLGVWQNPNSGLNASYAPFNPYATPSAPVVSESPLPSPTSTFEVGTMIPIPYDEETTDTQSGGGWAGVAIGGVVLLGGAGGVYAYALNQNKKRKLAARNAAANRRNAAGAGTGAAGAAAAGTTAGGTAANGANSPYTRRAVAAPPVSGSTQRKDGTTPMSYNGSATNAPRGTSPYAGTVNPGSTNTTGTTPYGSGASNPFARPPEDNSPYARPVTDAAAAGTFGAATAAGTTATGAPATGTPAESTNPYAAPKSPAGSNATGTTATGSVPGAGNANPYAQTKPMGASGSPANPYASAQTDAEEPTNPTPRRTSRTSRHQSQNPDDEI